MGVLADTIDEVQKLPPVGKLAVGVGGLGLLTWLYLSHRGAGAASSAALTGDVAPGVGGFGGIVTGGGASSGAPSSPTSTGTTTTTKPAPPPKPPAKTTPPKPPAKVAPPKPTSTRPAGYNGPQSYTVRSGDYLSAIASRYAVPGGWQRIYQLNRAVIGGNPNLIRPGQVLRLY